jgi:hypothetical protein
VRSVVADANVFVSFFVERNDAVATFDRKLANKLPTFGLSSYF